MTQTAAIEGNVPVLPFAEFRRQFAWKQGEHVSLIGPTGSGKTTLAYDLLKQRKYVVIIGTKPRDSSLTRFAQSQDYTVIRGRWPKTEQDDKILYWPKFDISSTDVQKARITEALLDIFELGGYTVYVDETYYLSELLGLSTLLKLYWTQARSNDISLVAATQRPRDVPLLMYSQATHLFFWRFTDDYDLKRIGGIGAANSAQVANTVRNLPFHTFLYVNAANGRMAISNTRS